jgi:hypothetical protein
MDVDRYKDIRIVLRLYGEQVLSRDVTGAFDDLEALLFQSDRKLVQDVSRRIALEPLLRDATLERVRLFRGQRIKLDRIGGGSFVFELLVSGIGVWLLKETVGECVKKGWKDSSVYSQLSDAVKESVEGLAEHIYLLLKRLDRRIASAETRLLLPPAADMPTIEINQNVSLKRSGEEVPSLSRAIDQLKAMR